MSEELKIIENENGTFDMYDDTYDITIHCASAAEQEEVLAKLNAHYDWISVEDEQPEDADAYLVTWEHPKYKSRFIGICEWDGERWLVEDMEQSKLYSDPLIIRAWADVEPYRRDME